MIETRHYQKPNLPPAAECEILERLSENFSISSEEIAQILKRHDVSGDPEALQHSYRKRLGQRLMASFRDEGGSRALLSSGRTYVVLDCCNDQNVLHKIDKRLSVEMAGLDNSIYQVKKRMGRLNRFKMPRLEELA